MIAEFSIYWGFAMVMLVTGACLYQVWRFSNDAKLSREPCECGAQGACEPCKARVRFWRGS